MKLYASPVNWQHPRGKLTQVSLVLIAANTSSFSVETCYFSHINIELINKDKAVENNSRLELKRLTSQPNIGAKEKSILNSPSRYEMLQCCSI